MGYTSFLVDFPSPLAAMAGDDFPSNYTGIGRNFKYLASSAPLRLHLARNRLKNGWNTAGVGSAAGCRRSDRERSPACRENKRRDPAAAGSRRTQ